MLSGPVIAQTADTSKATSEQVSALDDIVVTATRRDASINDVPLSIQALGAEDLAEQGAFDFNSYSRSVTGLSSLDRGPGQQLVTIRGVSSDTSVTNTDAPESKETTAIYFDETPVSLSGYNPDLQLVDINRVEVLKGPQGTLFGAGALAGAIRIITNTPDLDDFGGHAEVDYSDYEGGGQNSAGNVVLNLPIITDALALRVVGYSRDEAGFIDNVGLDGDAAAGRIQENVNSASIRGGRVQLRYAPSTMVDATLKLIRQETHLAGTQNVDVDPSRGGTPNADIPAGRILSDREQYRRGAEPYDDEITILNGDVALHFDAFDLISSTSYIERDQTADIDFSNFLPVAFGIGRLSRPGMLYNQTEVEDFTQEVRLVSSDPDHAFQWIAGAFYNQQSKAFGQDLVSQGINADNGGAFGSDNLLSTVATFEDEQFALFGEASYRWGDLTATAGLRYFRFKSVYDIVGDGAALGGPKSLIGRVTEDDGFNPKFSLSYAPDDDRLFYAQAARGFRLGGINDPLLSFCSPDDVASYVDDFGSDSLWNYEAGAKVGWLDRRVQTNLSVYRIDWQDVPITRALSCGISNVTTAGALEINGFEFDASAQLTSFWRLSGGFSFSDATISEIDPAVSASTGIVEGERSAGVAPWNANLTSSFETPMDWGGFLYANATYQYVGKIFNYPGALDPRRFEQPDYEIVSLRLGVRRENWDASVFVNNVFDERALLFRDRILGETRDSINRPRTIGINIKADF